MYTHAHAITRRHMRVLCVCAQRQHSARCVCTHERTNTHAGVLLRTRWIPADTGAAGASRLLEGREVTGPKSQGRWGHSPSRVCQSHVLRTPPCGACNTCGDLGPQRREGRQAQQPLCTPNSLCHPLASLPQPLGPLEEPSCCFRTPMLNAQMLARGWQCPLWGSREPLGAAPRLQALEQPDAVTGSVAG